MSIEPPDRQRARAWTDRKLTPLKGGQADHGTAVVVATDRRIELAAPDENRDLSRVLVPYARFFERRAWRAKIAADLEWLAHHRPSASWPRQGPGSRRPFGPT